MLWRIVCNHMSATYAVTDLLVRWANGDKRALDDLTPLVSFQKARSRELLALDCGLTALEKLDPRKCRAVELRYFGGLSMDEIARALDVSPVTVRRDLRMAEAWLRHEIHSG